MEGEEEFGGGNGEEKGDECGNRKVAEGKLEKEGVDGENE